MTSETATSILKLSARDTARKVATGDLRAVDVAAAFLEVCEAREPAVQAWKHLSAEEVLAEATRLDEAGASGPLAGVTVGVKDVIDTKTMPTGYGSEIYEGFYSYWDAPCVVLSRSADALIMGKTVSTEFAMSHPGKTRNPYNPEHTPGGSSSGSCAAVSAGMVHVAFGTQTAGSIVRPAAYCGVTGYKPTFGTLDASGVKVLSHNLDTLGLIGRDVRDVAWVTAQVAARPGLEVQGEPAKPVVGLFRTSRWELAEPAAVAAMETAERRLKDAGVTVRVVEVADGFDRLHQAHHGIMGWETTQAIAYERLHHWDRLGGNTKDFLTLLGTATLDDYEAAKAEVIRQRETLHGLMDGLDVLVTPPAPGTAPEGLSVTGAPVFNTPWTTMQVPCLSLPVELHGGLPTGIQVVGRYGEDSRMLYAAAYIEAVLGFSDRLY
ncbi:amidase [Roseibium aggregatum]|uniref:Amidase n=1 Tax=Roseibium aggregatum TaxID=187304 RepID=A0A939EJJ5_9HYPH|nr:amidase [Roseibium aggregatum]MBN9673896.1 amidase [Roseibium aggregatum]